MVMELVRVVGSDREDRLTIASAHSRCVRQAHSGNCSLRTRPWSAPTGNKIAELRPAGHHMVRTARRGFRIAVRLAHESGMDYVWVGIDLRQGNADALAAIQ